jgi:hypothetical protein
MCRLLRSLVPLLPSVSLVGCNNTEVRDDTTVGSFRFTGPSPSVTPSIAPLMFVQPEIVVAHPFLPSLCPPITRTVADFDLVVTERAGFDLTLHEVHLRFVDRFGVAAPTVFLPHPVLLDRFGPTVVLPRSVRRFPLSFDLGCARVTTGRLFLITKVRPASGELHSSTVSVSVR